MVERQGADDVGVVGEHHQADAIVAAPADERADRVLDRVEPRSRDSCRGGSQRRRRRRTHRLLHARRQIEQDDDIQAARLQIGLRKRNHRLHQRQPEQGDGDRQHRERQPPDQRRPQPQRAQPFGAGHRRKPPAHTPLEQNDDRQCRRHPDAGLRVEKAHQRPASTCSASRSASRHAAAGGSAPSGA